MATPTHQRLAKHFTTEKQRNFETNFLLATDRNEYWEEIEIGRSEKGKLTYKVAEEDVLSYNLSLFEEDPLLVDPKAAKEKSPTGELIQHPLFVVQVAFYCIEQGPGSWIRTPGARNPGQRIDIIEPFKVGETLTMTVTHDDKWIRRDKHYITDRLDFHNEKGVLKATWWLSLIIPPNREAVAKFVKA